MKENYDNMNEKLETVIARTDVDNEQIVDNTERQDKVDCNIKFLEIRMKEAEVTIDNQNKKESNNPKIDKLEKEIENIKKNLSNKSNTDTADITVMNIEKRS